MAASFQHFFTPCSPHIVKELMPSSFLMINFLSTVTLNYLPTPPVPSCSLNVSPTFKKEKVFEAIISCLHVSISTKSPPVHPSNLHNTTPPHLSHKWFLLKSPMTPVSQNQRILFSGPLSLSLKSKVYLHGFLYIKHCLSPEPPDFLLLPFWSPFLNFLMGSSYSPELLIPGNFSLLCPPFVLFPQEIYYTTAQS